MFTLRAWNKTRSLHIVHSLQYTTVHYSTLQYTTVHYSTLQYTTVHYSTLRCVIAQKYHCVCEWPSLCLVHQVYFQASRRDLLSILNLQLRPRLQRVDRTFHFYHPEKTFLKKQFELQQNILAQGLESKHCGEK